MGYSKKDSLRIQQGTCVDCKTSPALPDRRRCDPCRIAVNERERTRYKQRILRLRRAALKKEQDAAK